MHQCISGPMHRYRGCFKGLNNLITELGAKLKVAALGGSKTVTNIQLDIYAYRQKRIEN